MARSSQPLLRGIQRRCARCGGGGLFTKWFTITPDCPTCGYHFEREDGYWLGALIVSMAAIIVAFVAMIGITFALTWPDPPWTALTIAMVVVGGLLPVAFYPFSKTIWVGLDLTFNPPPPTPGD